MGIPVQDCLLAAFNSSQVSGILSGIFLVWRTMVAKTDSKENRGY